MGLQKDDTVTAKSMKSLMSCSLNETTHLLNSNDLCNYFQSFHCVK